MKRITFLFAFLPLLSQSQVGINNTGAAPHSSAMLDVQSTTGGFLLPRMTEEERDAIADPALGLQIYNTTSECIEAYLSIWVSVACKCQNPPSSAFTGPTGTVVAFTPAAFSGPGGAASYSWTFENGQPATSGLQNPSVSWSTGGTFDVSLTVTDNLGCSSTTAGSVTVSLSSPSLVCQPGYNITAGANYGDLGCITFTYRNNTVTYTTVRAADGNEWLRQNLGATSVASSFSDADGFGDLFQWGRWDDGHQVRSPGTLTNGVASPNNPTAFTGSPNGTNPFYHNSTIWWSGGASSDLWNGSTAGDITAARGIDPCKQLLGTDWRQPSGGTVSDWSTVISAEGITNATTAYNSRLRLTGAGYRSHTSGTIGGAGTDGIYWSSTANAGSGTGIHAYFGSSSVSGAGGDPRGSGFSVRCLRN